MGSWQPHSPMTGAPYAGPFGPPLSEQAQQALHNYTLGASPFENHGPRRSAPAERGYTQYDPASKAWVRHGRARGAGFRPQQYFTRPSDGKRDGTWGRLRDVFQGEGADIFVTTSGDRRTLMRDRPQRHQWGGWDLTNQEKVERRLFDRDWRPQDDMPVWESGWTRGARRGGLGGRYNFLSRKFEDEGTITSKPWGAVWSDARWSPGAKRGDVLPWSVRDQAYNWQTRVPWDAGLYPGGRPRV